MFFFGCFILGSCRLLLATSRRRAAANIDCFLRHRPSTPHRFVCLCLSVSLSLSLSLAPLSLHFISAFSLLVISLIHFLFWSGVAVLVTFLLSKYFLVIINWDVDLIRCRILIAARSLPENFFFFFFFYFNIFFLQLLNWLSMTTH